MFHYMGYPGGILRRSPEAYHEYLIFVVVFYGKDPGARPLMGKHPYRAVQLIYDAFL